MLCFSLLLHHPCFHVTVSCMNDSIVTSELWTHITSYISLFFILTTLKVHQLHGWTFVLQWHTVILILLSVVTSSPRYTIPEYVFFLTLIHWWITFIPLHCLTHSRSNDRLIITCVTRRRNSWLLLSTDLHQLLKKYCSLVTFQLSYSCLLSITRQTVNNLTILVATGRMNEK